MTESHTSRTLQAIPAAKRTGKRQRTILGALLAVLGVLAALTSFAVTLRLVWTGAEIHRWSVVLVALPFGGGLLMAVLGAHVASGELVSAALRDITTAVRRIWRRNGNGGSS